MKQSNLSELILASASPRRKELLEQVGIRVAVMPSGAEENIRETDPEKLVQALSELKCRDVAAQVRNGVVLGADTVVAADGSILGKPKDETDAERMLERLSGKRHQVYTGVTMIRVSEGTFVRSVTFSEKTDVFVVPMETDEIRSYIATGEPMDKAGAYGIQGAFAKYIGRIEGDYFNVVGLPLAAVYRAWKALMREQEETGED